VQHPDSRVADFAQTLNAELCAIQDYAVSRE